MDNLRDLVGGLNPSEKYESQLGLLFPTYGKIKNVPNHQPVYHNRIWHIWNIYVYMMSGIYDHI